jgi:hypothetical protein
MRFLLLILTAPFGIAGYDLLFSYFSPGVYYFATYLIPTAYFICTGGNITWPSANCAPDGKRAASLNILLIHSNIGGIVSGQIYQSNAAPKSTLGHAWSLGCLASAVWPLRRTGYVKERRGDKGQEDWSRLSRALWYDVHRSGARLRISNSTFEMTWRRTSLFERYPGQTGDAKQTQKYICFARCFGALTTYIHFDISPGMIEL